MKLTGSRCQCAACNLYFNSVYAFDRHRQGGYLERRCLPITTLIERGFGINKAGFLVSSLRSDR